MTRSSTRLSLATLALVGGATLSLGAQAASSDVYIGTITGEHGTKTHPTGEVKATLDPKTNVLKYSITWKGLSGPVQVAHFHGPAAFDQDAGVLQPVPGPYESPLSGQVTLDAAQEDDLAKGLVYLNLHTAEHPNGEARAQLVKH